MSDLMLNLYELIHGFQPDLRFRDSIYPQIAPSLFMVSLLAVLAYYYGVGAFSSAYSRTVHWFGAMGINALLCGLFVWYIGYGAFETFIVPGAVLTLCAIQALYSALIFMFLSIVLKWGSFNARRTPF